MIMSDSGSVKNYDEGLGTVYERFMLNDYFERLTASHSINNTLEVPIYGMTGLTGINSFHLALKGCSITLVDNKKENVLEAEALWGSLPAEGRHEILWHEDFSKLPFNDDSFDLVWNFAALWHVKDADLLLSEMARVSSDLVLIFVPNRKQPGYPLRKYVLDREFFRRIDESWINLDKITRHLKTKGMKVIDEGLIDIPFWPDTAFPVKDVFKRISKNSNGNGKGSGHKASQGIWNWDIMRYYKGDDPQLKSKIDKLSFLEKSSMPRQFKLFWAHHIYKLYSKN